MCEGVQRGPNRATALGQDVQAAGGVVGVGPALEQTGVDEPAPEMIATTMAMPSAVPR